MDFNEWKADVLRLAEKKGLKIWDDTLVRHWKGKFSVDDVLLSCEAGKRCMGNQEAVQTAKKCGCFYCLKIFDPREVEITQWADGCFGIPFTALCPYCDIDSVLPETPDYPISQEFLERLHEVKFAAIVL